MAALAGVLGLALVFLVARTAFARHDAAAPSSASIEIGFHAPTAQQPAASTVVCSGPELRDEHGRLTDGESLVLSDLHSGSYTCKIVIDPR